MLNATRRLGAALLLSLAAAIAWSQSPVHPLKPPDRSSPRAALATFLDSTDAVSAFIAREYLPSPSRTKFARIIELSAIPVEGLDVSALSPAARQKGGRAAAWSLYEVLNRIELPPLERIPDSSQLGVAPGGEARWVIPDTEIALVRVPSGPRSGEFLFSADTVARAELFYERVRHLPYRRPVPIAGLKDLIVSGGGWMIPYAWIRAMPAALRTPLADQGLWKWIGLALILALFALILWMAYRLPQRRRDQSPFRQALAQLALPASVLAATPVAAYLALRQLNLTDAVGVTVNLSATVITFLAAGWLWWRLAPVLAEAIIASPRIGSESVDAHLIRLSARLLGMLGAAAFLALGANQLGIPVYGIVAGLGVGGLAIALAAQPTIENLIGGLNLFADKPIRVGDVCKYGDAVGTVEVIGIRSTRIRGADRTLTTVPNSVLAKMPIVNLTQRDRQLIQSTITLPSETTREQLRHNLVKLRELLRAHPRVDPDSVRVRFVAFGKSSLDIEVFAYVTTRDWVEFLGIREDILLRIMGVLEQGGAGATFPS